MGWFDKLEKLIDIKNVHFSLINITRDSYNNKIDEKTGYYYDPKTKILHLNLDKIPKEIAKELRPSTQKFIEEGHKLLEIDVKDLLERLYKYNKDNPDKNILTFFKGIIPDEDYEALNSALFLRSQFKEGKNITNLKSDIRVRFGDRGNNISNLCTAGYFEEFLMPLYNSSKSDFLKLYDIIISKSIIAVFVHSHMDLESIPHEMSSKLGLCKQYGIKFIHIHGIGESNIKKIKDCIEEYKEDFDFFEKNIYEDEEEHIIVVELLFK